MAKHNKANNSAMYMDIISSLASTAASKVKGVTVIGNEKNFYKSNSFRVYIDDDTVVIDVFIDVMHGYKVPDVACEVQEAIKNEVESATRFQVNKVNVRVTNVVFP